MNDSSKDSVFVFLKSHAFLAPELSPASRFAIFSKIKELREKSFKKSLVYVPVCFAGLVFILFSTTVLIQNQRDSMDSISFDTETEDFLFESFSFALEEQVQNFEFID